MNKSRRLLTCFCCLAAFACARWALPEEKPVDDGQDINSLLEKLRTANHEDWEMTAKELGSLGRSVVPRLIEELGTANEKPGDYCWRLTNALAQVGPDAIPAILVAYKQAIPMKRCQNRIFPLCAVLAKIGKDALPAIDGILKSENVMERYYAVEALGMMGEKVPAALPFIISALKDKHDLVRSAAAQSLWKFGLGAVDGLLGALEDKTPDVRMWSMESLERLSQDHALPEAALAPVMRGLDDAYDNVPSHAIKTLANFGPRAQPALPRLLKLLQDKRDYLREECLKALPKIGLDANGVEPALAKALGCEYPEVRLAAAEMLSRSGAKSKETIQSLLLALQDKESSVRIQAIEALNFAGCCDSTSVPQLSKAFTDSEAFVRIGALGILTRMGAQAKESTLAIREMAKSNDAWECWASLEALHSIAGDAEPAANSFPAGAFAGRTPTGRAYLCFRHAGTVDTQRSMELALQWLAEHQEADGHWDCMKLGGKKADVAVTGMALLAFLGAGNTNKHGSYKDNTARALTWLRSVQNEAGAFVQEGGEARGGYHHAIAGLAMAEAAGMEKSEDVVRSAQKAIDYSINIHQKKEGGWSYTPKDDRVNLSTTSWFVQQLVFAKAAGLKVDQAALNQAAKYLDRLEYKGSEDNLPLRHRYGYSNSDNVQPCRTAMGCYLRQLQGARLDEIQNAIDWFLKTDGLPEADSMNKRLDLFYFYYGTLCVSRQGGDSWSRWNEALKKTLMGSQHLDYDARGSWTPAGSYAEHWGTVGQTAIGALCLESYYRYSFETR